MNKIIRIINYFQKKKIYSLICLVILSSLVELLLLYSLQPIIYYFSDSSNSVNFYNFKFIFEKKF